MPCHGGQTPTSVVSALESFQRDLEDLTTSLCGLGHALDGGLSSLGLSSSRANFEKIAVDVNPGKQGKRKSL